MKEKIWEWVKKHNVALLTVLSGLIGATVFIIIYGIEVLNVTNDAWLCNSEDLTQHYLGWVFFRDSNWAFPIRTF